MIGLFAVAGFSLLVVATINATAISSSSEANFNAIMVFIFLGKLGISGTYGLVVLFVTEIFPTNIRSKALGVCTIGARAGSIWSPYAGVSVTLSVTSPCAGVSYSLCNGTLSWGKCHFFVFNGHSHKT